MLLGIVLIAGAIGGVVLLTSGDDEPRRVAVTTTGAVLAATTSNPSTSVPSTTIAAPSATTAPASDGAYQGGLIELPGPVLDALGSPDEIRLADQRLILNGRGWTGSTGSTAAMDAGDFLEFDGALAGDFFVVLRLSTPADTLFEVMIEEGTWGEPDFRPWGVYGGGWLRRQRLGGPGSNRHRIADRSTG